jgi:hypothetical protein
LEDASICTVLTMRHVLMPQQQQQCHLTVTPLRLTFSTFQLPSSSNEPTTLST